MRTFQGKEEGAAEPRWKDACISALGVTKAGLKYDNITNGA